MKHYILTEIPVSYSFYDEFTACIWAFQDHGHWGVKMHRSKDFGGHWEEINAPMYPEGAEVRDGVPASLKYIWAAASSQQNEHKIYLGTDPGGLFYSKDNGANWELNQGLWNRPERKTNWFGGGRDNPGIHSIVIDPKDDAHFYIGISCAGVYETIDGGQTWKGKNNGLRADFLPDPYSEYGHDPHLLLASPSKPTVMWQQNHCGIFRSVDGGGHWKDIGQENGPAKFGFAIALHHLNDECAWVAPAISDEIRVAVGQRMMICRTENGGESWENLTNGLPQDLSFDIVYRHSLIADGDELSFGTTTGNLFYSSDGGDHWEVISNYLPMVYALSFVEN